MSLLPSTLAITSLRSLSHHMDRFNILPTPRHLSSLLRTCTTPPKLQQHPPYTKTAFTHSQALAIYSPTSMKSPSKTYPPHKAIGLASLHGWLTFFSPGQTSIFRLQSISSSGRGNQIYHINLHAIWNNNLRTMMWKRYLETRTTLWIHLKRFLSWIRRRLQTHPALPITRSWILGVEYPRLCGMLRCN